jgi:hypothetical protein
VVTQQDAVQDRDALLDAAHRLVQEYRSLPAGSVLRCFARCVRDERRRGAGSVTTARELLPGILATTRARLDGRSAGSEGAVPTQRRRGSAHRSGAALGG